MTAARIQRVVVEHEDYETFNIYLIQIKGTTTLANNSTNGASTFVVTSATGAVIGEAVNIYYDNHVFQSIVSNIAGTTITIAGPLDRSFPAGSAVQFGAWNMNLNGAVTPVTHEFLPLTLTKGIHVIAISGAMTDNAAMDETTFGGLPALTNPVYMYLDNEEDNKKFLINNNAGFYEWGADTDYPARVPAGTYSFRFRKRLLQTNESGTHLNPRNGDSIKHVNRSDLTGLTKYVIILHGHIR